MLPALLLTIYITEQSTVLFVLDLQSLKNSTTILLRSTVRFKTAAKHKQNTRINASRESEGE